MNRILVLSTLLAVCALSFASLPPNNRYGGPQHGNSLGYRGGAARGGVGARGDQGRYSAPQSHRAPVSHYGAPSAPRSPSVPHSPSAPRSPRYGGHQQSAPRSYGGQQSAYGGHQAGPAPYGGGSRHLGGAAGGLNQYGGPAPYGGPVPYGGQAYGSGLSHISSPRRSVYESQQSSSASSHSNVGYQPPQPQHFSQVHETAQSRAQTHGREMKYTIQDPHNKGTTHVTETHVVSNRQMHGAEAEAAMKKLMGSMGPGGDNGFGDLFKGFGF